MNLLITVFFRALMLVMFGKLVACTTFLPPHRVWIDSRGVKLLRLPMGICLLLFCGLFGVRLMTLFLITLDQEYKIVLQKFSPWFIFAQWLLPTSPRPPQEQRRSS
jgi:H+/Cl- antiporter ClcA